MAEVAVETGTVKTAKPARRGLGRFFGGLITLIVLVALFVPPLSVLVYRLVPPPITILMIERLIQGHGLDYQWRPLSEISPALPDQMARYRAVMRSATIAGLRAQHTTRVPNGRLMKRVRKSSQSSSRMIAELIPRECLADWR